MGRAFQVRAKSMAETASAKSALYNRMSKEVYMAAKAGVPDINMNLSLKAAVDRAKRKSVPSHVIENAINKAKGASGENFVSHRYEGYGPGNSSIIVDALTDNVNRAVSEIRNVFTKCGGKLGVAGSVSHSFSRTSIVAFNGKTADETLEILLETDAEIKNIEEDSEDTIIYSEPNSLNIVKETLEKAGINNFAMAEVTELAFETITIEGEDLEKFNRLISMLGELQDVQDVYHNVSLD